MVGTTGANWQDRSTKFVYSVSFPELHIEVDSYAQMSNISVELNFASYMNGRKSFPELHIEVDSYAQMSNISVELNFASNMNGK
ncbi:hypothetical protein ACROYT_G015259 [Oculina patagonica]